MNASIRTSLWSGALLVMGVALAAGCKSSSDVAANSAAEPAPRAASRTVNSGTTISVLLGSTLSSETAAVGDAWQGTLAGNLATEHGDEIAAGTPVDGVVSGVTRAERGSRAMLDLSVRGITVNGRRHAMSANGDAVIAGSTRARNLGAIAGGAVAGALIGKTVGDGKNAAVGGLLGGAAATGVVAGSKGYQVVLKAGSSMEFTVNQTVAVR